MHTRRLKTLVSAVIASLILFLGFSAHAQDAVPAPDEPIEVIVRVVHGWAHKNQKATFLDELKVAAAQSDPESYYKVFKNSGTGQLLGDGQMNAVHIWQHEYLFVGFFKKKAPFDFMAMDGAALKVTISRGEQSETFSLPPSYCSQTSPYICAIPVIEIPKIDRAQHKDLITITPFASKSNLVKPSKFLGLRYRPVQSYGWDFTNTGAVGLWIPVGIFATNFQRSADGLQFSALPIGVAVGTKFYMSKDFYLGVSGTGMWAITSGDTVDSSGSKQATATLRSLGAGFLLDISSIMYVTATYQWNFAEGQTNPGWMMGLGFGADILKRIAAGK